MGFHTASTHNRLGGTAYSITSSARARIEGGTVMLRYIEARHTFEQGDRTVSWDGLILDGREETAPPF